MQKEELKDVELSMKHKHLMVRRVYSSFTIPLEEKKEFLEKIASEDTSDWTEKTRYYCQAAHPTLEIK